MSPIYSDVLLVEDDDTFAQVIARNLTSRGVTVRRAATGADACRQIRLRRPELLLLDINLPDLTGWDVLRETRDGTHLATIVISAVPLRPERVAEFKPLAYLPKPFPLDVLLRLVVGQPAEVEAS